MRHLNEIYDLRFSGCRMSRAQAAAWLGVSVRTLQRHETALQPVHGPIYRALRLRAGHLEDIDSSWRGWRICADRIFWPGDRYGLSAGQIMAIVFDRQRLRLLERQLRQLRQQYGIVIAGASNVDGQFSVHFPLTETQDNQLKEVVEKEQGAELLPLAPFLHRVTK